jgi:uncharacterized protein (TIGR03083 family)
MADHSRAFVTALRTDADALLYAAGQNPRALVACCPGWDTEILAAHIGRIWHYVSRQALSTEPVDDSGAPPAGTGTLDWAADGLAALLLVLAELEPETPTWNWARGVPDTAAFWQRRMAQETAIHRWDAQDAVGTAEPIVPWLAADGVEEAMQMWLPRRRGRAKEEVTGTAHLHATDPVAGHPSEWFIELGERGATSYRHGHEKGDAVLRGTASDLVLRLWGRPSAVEAMGEAEILGTLRAE